jgi:hypothetical protein
MATGDFPCTPVYEEGDRLNCVAGTSGNVQGKRFVVAAADKQPGWAGLTTSTAGGRIIVARAGAGVKALGVAAWDALDGDAVTTYRAGKVVPVVAGATVTAGSEVESDSTGRCINLASGKACGYCVAGATVGNDALIVLY